MDPTAGKVKKFGTAPVFLTAISTILGAIMFLRFGYAVGHTGFLGVLAIIIVGHLVTVPTAMAIGEIATNQKVQGGGEYYIISRSFGLIIGAAIGISLFLSQAISVAFYIIAFAEAFDPVIDWLREQHGLLIPDKRFISLPVTILMTVLILRKGADLGIKALYVVVGTLFISLALFFAGKTGYTPGESFQVLTNTVKHPAPFFVVFAICFPAFTGMTAGVGLSGDLRDPQRSIPLGTLAATVTGMLVYVLIAYKLALSASPEDLVGDQLIMSRIAVWGPIIPIGLACATFSSALGSFLVAPRTLQAIGEDKVLPWGFINSWLSKGAGQINEPVNASIVTTLIAVAFVSVGDVNFVAKIISMFFMVTYGSICLISFLEHFAADPAYRPTFRSRWYVSLFGAMTCGWLMFKMNPGYAFLAIAVMFILYMTLARYNEEKRGLSNMVQGAIFQISRQIHVFLQTSRKQEGEGWRPAVVCLSESSFDRLAAFDLLRWISHRYGFGTYIHYIQGYFSRSTMEQSRATFQRLVRMADVSGSNIYVDTIVSPSYTTAIAQLVQLPGISGKENNMVLLEFNKDNPHADLSRIVDNYPLIASAGFDVCVLGSSDRVYGYRREIHIWLNPSDYENASLMILMAYIMLGHPEWNKAAIRIFSVLPKNTVSEEEENLRRLIRSGRLPISDRNLETIPQTAEMDRRALIRERSQDADLVIIGFRGEAVKRLKGDVFTGYTGIGNVLFVNTVKEIDLVKDEVEDVAEPESEPDANGAARNGSNDGH